MEIYIMRHGETDWNKNDRLQGQADTKLNETGRQQAIQVADFFAQRGLTFDRIISSPLDRAIETGELVTRQPRHTFTIDARLLELSYGPMEGVHFEDLPPEVFPFFRDPVHVKAPCGIEQMEALTKRCGSFFEELSHHNSNETILILTHGVAMRCIIGYIGHLTSTDIWKLDIDNCAVYKTTLTNHIYSFPEVFK